MRSYFDTMLTHAIYFERYKTHEVNQLLDLLDSANERSRELILKAKTIATKARYREVMKEIAHIRDEAVSIIDKQMSFDSLRLVERELRHQIETLTDVGVKLDVFNFAPQKLHTAATFMPFAASHSFEKMMRDLGDDMWERWDMAVRVGYLTGETVGEITKRVLGATNGLLPGTMRKVRTDLEANTRTILAHYAEYSRNAVYEENKDIITGYKRIETLDGRTCIECGLEDGKEYKTLQDAPSLPAHLRCRGLYIPLLRGIDIFNGERATKDGPISANTTWRQWIEKQPEALKKDILGPSRYMLYKKSAPLGGFVVDGRKISLEQWSEIDGNINKYGKPFKL